MFTSKRLSRASNSCADRHRNEANRNATERSAHTVSAPDNPITVGDVLRWHGPLGHLLTAAHRRTAGPWNPLWRSPAALETADTSRLRRPDGTTWGDAPLGSAYTAAGLLIAATVEHADAAHRLLASSPTSSLALDTMTRAALEAAAQAWWLLDPAIDGRTRVARLYTLRRASAIALENTAAQLGLTSAQGYGA